MEWQGVILFLLLDVFLIALFYAIAYTPAGQVQEERKTTKRRRCNGN